MEEHSEEGHGREADFDNDTHHGRGICGEAVEAELMREMRRDKAEADRRSALWIPSGMNRSGDVKRRHRTEFEFPVPNPEFRESFTLTPKEKSEHGFVYTFEGEIF